MSWGQVVGGGSLAVLNRVPPERQGAVLTPGTCGYGVLSKEGLHRCDHGQERPEWRREALNPRTGVLVKRPRDDRGRGWHDVSTSQALRHQ